MPNTSINIHIRSASWKALPLADIDRKLTSLGLHLDRDERTMICITCEDSLKSSGEAVSKHLWEKHEVPTGARKGLNAFVRSLGLPDPNKLELRPDGDALTRISLLRLALPHGRKSDRKNWLRDEIRDNLRLQSWTQNGARGYWIVNTSEQTAPSVAPHTSECSPRRHQRVAVLHEEERQRVQDNEHHHLATDTGIDDLALTSNWMRRTGWADTFAGADRQLLSQLADTPARDGFGLHLRECSGKKISSSVEDERRLAAIGHAVDHFFDRCEDTARNTDHSVRCWLRSHVPGRPYKAPFQLPGRDQTKKRYRGLWKSLVYFMARLYRLDAQVREGKLGVRLSKQQRQAIERVWTFSEADSDRTSRDSRLQDLQCSSSSSAADGSGSREENLVAGTVGRGSLRDGMLRRSGRGSRASLMHALPASQEEDEAETRPVLSDENPSDNEYENSDLSSVEDGRNGIDASEEDVGLTLRGRSNKLSSSHSVPTPLEEELADLVGMLSAFLCTKEFADSHSSSTILVYFSGGLGFSAETLTFERPRNYTPKLSALIHCIRLCLLEATLPRFAHPSLHWEARPRTGNLKRLNKVRERYMCLSCQSPMGELLSLRTYGRAISRSDGPSFRVQWSEDS
ncbi:hypothetical protein LTR37_021276 [Vermiconidia calcicola]|uniref:Uncharacterized protein n=1 Tax=Vermiconidia calcicola TaxID=1690605 RepID=A0ACC3M940_9PEZI|nr:hypothetical protein LTR37_021276 [Vermiconidia calcicola]